MFIYNSFSLVSARFVIQLLLPYAIFSFLKEKTFNVSTMECLTQRGQNETKFNTKRTE